MCPSQVDPITDTLCRGTPSVLFALSHHVSGAMAEDLFRFWQPTADYNDYNTRQDGRTVRADTITRLSAFVRDFLILFSLRLILLQIFPRVRPIPIVYSLAL